ncbi:MAG: hypothetical protein GQ470_02505 [Gammaproteobacteria bacterium]|nr:hypothetical protein [Gammaproteobacteria bacterium]
MLLKTNLAYMEVGKGREHAYRDIGGRAMQEQLPRSGSFDPEQGVKPEVTGYF